MITKKFIGKNLKKCNQISESLHEIIFKLNLQVSDVFNFFIFEKLAIYNYQLF